MTTILVYINGEIIETRRCADASIDAALDELRESYSSLDGQLTFVVKL